MVVLGKYSASTASQEILIPLEYYLDDIMSLSYPLIQYTSPSLSSIEIGQSFRNNNAKVKTFLSPKIDPRQKPSETRAWHVDGTALAPWVASSETLRRYLASDRVLHHYFPDLEDNPFADCHGEEPFSPFFQNLMKGLENHKIYDYRPLCFERTEALKRLPSEVFVPIILQREGRWNRFADPVLSERMRAMDMTTSEKDSTNSTDSGSPSRNKFTPSSTMDVMTLRREKMGYGKSSKSNNEPRILTEEEEAERIRNEELAKVGMRIDNSWTREGNVIMGQDDIQVSSRRKFHWAENRPVWSKWM